MAFLALYNPVTSFVPQRAFAPGTATISTSLDVSVASTIVDSNNDGEPRNNNEDKPRLSRPERKALEREKKEKRGSNNTRHRKHNFQERQRTLQARDKVNGKEGTYDLHSNAVSQLTKSSTADDVMIAIKRAQNLHDVHDIRAIARFLLDECDISFAYGYRGSLLSRLAVAALHMNNHELARKALEERRKEYRPSMLPMESAAIIRGMLRVHNVTDALSILDDELALPLQVRLFWQF